MLPRKFRASCIPEKIKNLDKKKRETLSSENFRIYGTRLWAVSVISFHDVLHCDNVVCFFCPPQNRPMTNQKKTSRALILTVGLFVVTVSCFRVFLFSVTDKIFHIIIAHQISNFLESLIYVYIYISIYRSSTSFLFTISGALWIFLTCCIGKIDSCSSYVTLLVVCILPYFISSIMIS